MPDGRPVLLVDVDGVLLVHPHPLGWTATLEQDLGLSRERLQAAFFKPHWQDVVQGRAALRARLAPVLADIAPQLEVETLVRYWFEHDAHVDRVLLADLDRLRAGGLQIHLATVQEHERAAYLWNELGLRDRFDGIHYAAALGLSKPDPRFYAAVEARLATAHESLFLIDDQPANVDAALAAGWSAAVWTGRERLVDVLARHRWPDESVAATTPSMSS